ncbi:MAG: peptidase C39 family protein [Oleiphilaceae bacterium]|nr:peptidase C39 family protein [Oleiphilaceae bacterium]
MAQALELRPARMKDLDGLLALEQQCFQHDRLSRRSFRHWIQDAKGILLVLEEGGSIRAYGLVWCLQGTRLARLYSMAVHPEERGRGLAFTLLETLEQHARERGFLTMRLEVDTRNQAAIRLYERSGYRIFGEYHDYYDDHGDALRMHKPLRGAAQAHVQRVTPWYEQTTAFTCGPAALMMAMASLDERVQPSQSLELDLWREATTIFMTSGHGGCHPVGLALAACRRGFSAEVFVNTREPLFLEGVRSAHKKDVMQRVHQDFVSAAEHTPNLQLHYEELNDARIQQGLEQGEAWLVLISTYRLDNKKAPHWVCVSGIDEVCLYVHDPDRDGEEAQAIDCQYLPIARRDFAAMASFGRGRLRTAIALRRE